MEFGNIFSVARNTDEIVQLGITAKTTIDIAAKTVYEIREADFVRLPDA